MSGMEVKLYQTWSEGGGFIRILRVPLRDDTLNDKESGTWTMKAYNSQVGKAICRYVIICYPICTMGLGYYGLIIYEASLTARAKIATDSMRQEKLWEQK